MKRSQHALQEESHFEIDEMFFSITNSRGIILAGNEVFARVSKYPLGEMLKKPHNLIRHPDMPKAIFRLFWEEIQAGRPITAYIKNMASDGTYYWVIATAFPKEDKYISIRIKPSTELLNTIIDLYKEMLTIERGSGSIDESYKLLHDSIKKLNYTSYQHFMGQALKQELFSRQDEIFKLKTQRPRHDLIDQCGDAQRQTMKVATAFKNIMDCNGEIAISVGDVLKSFNSIKQLSLNLTISAHHLGEKAASMAVISEIFGSQATEIQSLLNSFQDMLANASSASFLPLEFKVLSATQQLGMIETFLIEIYKSSGNLNQLPEDVEDNCRELIELSFSYLKDVSEKLSELSVNMLTFKQQQAEFMVLINSLRVIHQMGKIELPRLNDGNEKFETQIEGMRSFINATYEPIKKVGENIDSIQTSIRESIIGIQQINRVCDSFSSQLLKRGRLTASPAS